MKAPKTREKNNSKRTKGNSYSHSQIIEIETDEVYKMPLFGQFDIDANGNKVQRTWDKPVVIRKVITHKNLHQERRMKKSQEANK